jgi:hypothetical protein
MKGQVIGSSGSYSRQRPVDSCKWGSWGVVVSLVPSIRCLSGARLVDRNIPRFSLGMSWVTHQTGVPRWRSSRSGMLPYVVRRLVT